MDNEQIENSLFRISNTLLQLEEKIDMQTESLTLAKQTANHNTKILLDILQGLQADVLQLRVSNTKSTARPVLSPKTPIVVDAVEPVQAPKISENDIKWDRRSTTPEDSFGYRIPNTKRD